MGDKMHLSIAITTKDNMIDKTKSNAIDYVKCIGIILVIFGHYPNNVINIIKPYTFHMPLFFFLGGLLFSTTKGWKKHYSGLMTKYFLYIIISYVILGLFVTFANHLFNTQNLNVFGSGLIDTISIAMKNNLHNNSLFMIGWFLYSYMLVLAVAFPLFYIVEKLKSNIIMPLLLIAIGLTIGYIAIVYVSPAYKLGGAFYLNTICQVMVGLMFFMIGYSTKTIIWEILNPTIAFILLLFVTALREMGLLHTLYMSWSTYNDGYLFSLIGALAGIYITFFFADVLSKSGEYFIMKKIGSSSKSIMTFHLTCFTIIDIIMTKLGMFNINKTNILVHFIAPYSFALYMFAGVAISMLIGNYLNKMTRGFYS